MPKGKPLIMAKVSVNALQALIDHVRATMMQAREFGRVERAVEVTARAVKIAKLKKGIFEDGKVG